MEFAIVGVLLFFLLFGVVGFGMLLSVKNTVTQAANEGARAAVSVFARNNYAGENAGEAQVATWKADAEDAAIARMRERLDYLEDDAGGPVETQCSSSSRCPDVSSLPALTYLARVHDCAVTDEAAITAPGNAVDSASDDDDCLFTRVTYDHEHHRILPTLPLVDLLMPDRVVDRADVALT